MPPENLAPHELFRLGLEEQLRRDVELLYQAYLTKLRAYETVARAQGEIAGGAPPLAPLTLALPAVPGFEIVALPAPAPAPPSLPPPSPGPAPARPSAPAKAKTARTADFVVYDAIVMAFGQLGDVFDKRELRRALGFEPKRTSLHSALDRLIKDGLLTVEWDVGRSNRYRKAAALRREMPPATAPAAGSGEGEPGPS